ncbi:hypothetical protein TSOC_012866 [Tetrabaena socialis]|uniref:ATP-dependent RNA helicase n=1 Tax=Tetrabaena socialis TaxID=47790 RepID=A0A2J7ZLX1_9CHLO|nr:hypothetical protein TSOC_012866 [Tetrabaena socialis]|eukprot:PNH01262.1 hypothetical protein TSOC_012866 [Tetrabaena socialis]
MRRDLQMLKDPPAILVATPGRLLDLLSNPEVARNFAVQTVILDEADRLLDPGFAPDVKKILRTMPGVDNRRTLLFTATVTDEVRAVAKNFMRPGYEYIDAPEHAGHANIMQSALLCGPSDVHVELARTLKSHASLVNRPKVMVFFPSTALLDLYYAVFKAHPDPAWSTLYALYGKMEPSKRVRAESAFRESGGVLFGSDAVGRGMDFKGVTLVVQIGFVPADTYQQRVGRTGRAGAAGQAVILLGRDEAKGLDKLKAAAPALEVLQAQPVLEAERKALALPPAQQKEAEAAFRGLLGANKSHAKALGLAPQGIVDAVAARLLGMGMAKVPHISDATLKKMGLTGVSFDTDAIKARVAA